MALISRSSWVAFGSLIMMAAAALIAFISGSLLLAMPLFMWSLSLQEGRALWSIAWILGSGFIIFFNIATAIEILREPTFGELRRVLFASAIAAVACPLWY